MNYEIMKGMKEFILKEAMQNRETVLDPLPLPGPQNGLSLEKPYVAKNHEEEIGLLKWLAGHAGKSLFRKKKPAPYHIQQDPNLIRKDDKVFERVTVVFSDSKLFLIRRANYYFDITSYCTTPQGLGSDKQTEKE